MKRVLAIAALACLLAVAGCSTETTGGDGGDEDAAAKWVKVITFKGNAAKTSAPFKLEGGEQKLEYSVEGGDMVTAAFYVEDEGTDIMEEGGFPVVMPDKAGKDSTRMNKDGGKYILIVESANCSWVVTVYEKR